ncbi:helix-turn-helix transcriptional regulator [Chryseobacterium aquaticum]|uniref:Helix-turn-helix transcriptional regulator n=1 Tax=Chryseobacterium aquaticum TaxID=452084 RepID=A0A848N7H3_9FLAO|nr:MULTISPECIES: helix-turn-helix transcriptional regulator [Chryseobacterium]NMR34942.1 helix-turn-helix transcriptional regulator [Chryseobacterium aquaticum]NRQ47194.1 helix-turn-helix transcriptional regulator [Chryseobacterium sp. C-204]
MIGNNIKNIRELKNLTQEFVAEKLDISQSAYSRLEKGEIKISKEKLVQIAEVLEVKPEDIKEFDGQKYFNSFNNVSDSNIESIVSGMGSEEIELIKKLYEDKIALMEQLMKQKDKEIEKYQSKYGEL